MPTRAVAREPRAPDIERPTTGTAARIAALRDWLRLLRIHQWAKNGLVLVPLLTAHRLDPASLALGLAAALAFSLCASAIYVVNDLVDLDADRAHPTKRRRPLAAGTIPIPHGLAVVPVLLAAALALAGLVGAAFAAVVLAYLALTTAYTFVLKRRMMLDVVALACLYTLRVVAGAAAIGVAPSEWLLGFSMMIFTGLALVKRYVELAMCLDAGLPDPSNRDYRAGDLPVVGALAAAACFNAVTVFALYVSSETVHRLYARPAALWLVCPVLMYWLGRVLMLAHRRELHDDPIVFALKDRASLAALAAIGAILAAAVWSP